MYAVYSYLEINTAGLIMIFLEIIFVINLCDLCGVVDDVTHYFILCRKYLDERQVFNDTVKDDQPINI